MAAVAQYEKHIASRKRSAALLSVASNSLLIALKLVVGILSGSVGVLAELVNSAADLAGSFIVFLSVRASDVPPDDKHAYGHGKIENLSGAATASLILTGGVYAIWQAVGQLRHPIVLRHYGPAMGVMAFSALLNAFVSWRLLRIGNETDSPAISADGHHLRTDIITSVGVLVGLALSLLTNQPWWDAVAALCVSLLILRVGYLLARDAVRTLADMALPPEEEQILRDVLDAHPEVLSFHKLRTRKSGSHRHADVHVQIADTHTFVEAHRVTEELEEDLRKALPNLHPIIHIEPFADEAIHQFQQHGVAEVKYRP